MQVFIIQIILLLISFYSLYMAPHQLERPYMLANCILAFVSIFNCYRQKEYNKLLKGQYLRHSALFLISYIVIFYQYFFDYSIGLAEPTHQTSKGQMVWYDQTVIPICIAISNIALNLFLLGYMCKKAKREQQITKFRYNPKYLSGLTVLNAFLIFLYVATINKAYLFGGYGKGLEMGALASRIGGYLVPSICAQVAIQTYLIKSKNQKVSLQRFIKRFKEPLIFIFIMAVLILMSGRRTDAIMFLSVLLLAYLIITKRVIAIKYILPSVIAFSILFFLIAELRRYNGTNTSDAMEMLSQNSTTISPITQELAFNCSSLEIALANIPDNIPYVWGLTWIGSFVSAIPAGPTLIGSFLSIPSMFQHSDILLSDIALGQYTFGIGTSILADIYVNIGIPGIVILMFLFGYVIRKLEEASFSKFSSPYVIGLSLVVYSSLIYMTRGSIWSPIGPMAYVLILIYLFTSRKKYGLKRKIKN